MTDFPVNESLDLALRREVDVPPEKVWAAWTTPESVKQWFAPKPWTITECHIDLRPGGAFTSTMRSPEGDEFPNSGCYIEIVPNRKLVFTDCLQPGYRPAANPFFTAVILLEPTANGGTSYTAIAIHGDEDRRKQHEEMGFHEGWGAVLDQMIEHIKANG